jgi:hypothetical protein
MSRDLVKVMILSFAAGAVAAVPFAACLGRPPAPAPAEAARRCASADVGASDRSECPDRR